MVIGLVSQGHTLLPEHPAPLPVDVQASLDGIGGGLLPEDAAHAVEQLEDTSGGIRMGYRPMCLCTLMVRGLLLWVMCPIRQARLCRRCARRCGHVYYLICCGMLTPPQLKHLPDDHVAHGLELFLFGKKQALRHLLRIGAANLLPPLVPQVVGG